MFLKGGAELLIICFKRLIVHRVAAACGNRLAEIAGPIVRGLLAGKSF